LSLVDNSQLFSGDIWSILGAHNTWKLQLLGLWDYC